MQKWWALLLFLGGCAAGSGAYERGLQKWIGEPEQALYQQWGAPSNVFYITPDRKIITFTHISQKAVTDPYTGEVSYQAINSGYETSTGYPYYCRTSFTVTDGFVTDYTFSGDDCVAEE
jgi:hypothetical protein